MGVNYNAKTVRSGLVLALDSANPRSLGQTNRNFVTNPTYSNVFPAYASLVTSGIDAPDGTMTAVRFSCNTTGAALLRVTFVPTAFTPNGTDTYTVSFYVRKISGTTSTSNQLTCDLQDLTPGGDYAPLLVTGSWVRVQFTAIPTSTLRNTFDLLSNNVNDYTLDFWGLQIERESSASTFYPSTSSGLSTTWKDISGLNNDATLTNTSFYSSANSGGIFFNSTSGSGQAIVPYSSSFDFSRAQTICMWIKPANGVTSQRRNFYNQAYGGPGTITLETDSLLTYYFGTNGGDNTPYVGRGLGFTVLPNETAFITVSRNQSTNVVKSYKNGVLIYTQDAGGYSSTANGNNPITIGNGYAGYFLGSVYLTLVYNVALTDNEILQNFNATKGRYGL